MTVNVISCNLPYGRAAIESTDDVFHVNIYVDKSLPPSEKKESVFHELTHLLKNDLYNDTHASLVEDLLHNGHCNVTEEDLHDISFYYFDIDE